MALDILKKLHRETLTAEELEDIYRNNRDSYRVVLALIQKRNFPVQISLGVIPKLFTPDLVQVIKNRMTNPQVRKRAEQEFLVKYRVMPAGEKKAVIRRAGPNILKELVFEANSVILKEIFTAPSCIGEVVFRFLLHGNADRTDLYAALAGTHWLKSPEIAEMVMRDKAAPVRAQIEALEGISSKALRKIVEDEEHHEAVIRGAIKLFRRRIES